MDPLALLCNLHADGPATLQRLRRAGCESLVALRRWTPADLAQRLEWNQRAAERFLREAALLGARVESEEQVPAFELESTLNEELEDDANEGEPEELGEGEDALDETEPAAAADPARVEALLGTWRELDRVAPPQDPAFLIPRPPPPVDLSLDGVALEGLSPALVRGLATQSVRTLRELLGANELELARKLGLGFTRLRRLRFLAERTLRTRSASTPLVPGARPSAFTPPPHEPFETAGPFA
jgi:hypothetical protein